MTLTADQQSVADDVLKKLFESKEQEIIISGPAGTGKSFLIKYILSDILSKYLKTTKVCGVQQKFCHEFPLITATTNKACGVLRQALDMSVSTIESALGLVVTGDYSKGEYKLAPGKNGLYCVSDSIVIIDEASMIDKHLYQYIKKCCIGCFIIYIGDDCQLPAVKEGNIPLIWQLGLPEYKLTTLVRQADNAEVEKLCRTMRKTVQTGQFFDIVTSPSIIHITDPEQKKEILRNYNYANGKILTYTNAKAIQYNEWIMKEIHGFEAPFYEGEDYVVNDYYKARNSSFRLPAESIVKVLSIEPKVTTNFNGADCSFMKLFVSSPSGSAFVHVPDDKVYFQKWLKYIAKYKEWRTYFEYKEKVVDLRGNYACTIHKSQGSTFDHVIIDANDFKSCTNPAIAARLLYVAVSRAKKGVIFFGELPKRYGEIICQRTRKPISLTGS